MQATSLLEPGETLNVIGEARHPYCDARAD
jgi:hypothetical protein